MFMIINYKIVCLRVVYSWHPNPPKVLLVFTHHLLAGSSTACNVVSFVSTDNPSTDKDVTFVLDGDIRDMYF